MEEDWRRENVGTVFPVDRLKKSRSDRSHARKVSTFFPQMLMSGQQTDGRVIVVDWWETGNWKVYEMVRTFRRSVPNGKRGLPLEVLYNLWSDFPQKFLFHFTFNRTFQIILLNGKHPNFPENIFKNCILPRDGSPLFPPERNSGNFLTVC